MGTIHTTHIHSKYHEDVKVGFVDSAEFESLVVVQPNQTRRIQDTKHGSISILLYLKNADAKTKDGFDTEPAEKLSGASDMSFIISKSAQIIRAKYGTVEVEEM